MCCCIPLRKLCYLGAGLHLLLGVLYLYYLGDTVYNLYSMRDKEKHQERLQMGLLYIGYYAAFMPPGIFIFCGVHKQVRRYLQYPSWMFLIIQAYGIVLQGIYKFKFGDIADIMLKYNQEGFLRSHQMDWLLELTVHLSITLVYLFMLFFYFREIAPDDNTPIVQSRYAQAYHQQIQQSHPPPPSQPPPQPPVPFRPVSAPATANTTNTTIPTPQFPSTQNLTLNRNSTPRPPLPPLGPSPLVNLTYEQQQQLLKLQQHPLILQQFQQFQHHYRHSHHQHQSHQEEDQQPMSLFHQGHPLHHHHQHHPTYTELMQDPSKKY